MSKIFIDSDAFVALWDEKDSNHKQSAVLAEDIKEKESDVHTSDFALGEAVTVISQNVGKKYAHQFIDFILTGSVIVERNSRKREFLVFHQFKKSTSKNTRFTDCLNIVIMKELGINEIFSFDKHYKKAGFKRYGID